MRKGFLSGISIGLIVGAISVTAVSAFASDAIEKVEAYIKQQPVKLNGQAVELENPALNYDGSTYLKVRDVAKITGLNVSYDEQTGTVLLDNKDPNGTKITPPSTNKPNHQEPPASSQGEVKQEDKYAGKVFVKGSDLYKVILDDSGESIVNTTKGENVIVIYNNKENLVSKSDQYYDMETQERYLNVDALKSFIADKYLSKTPKYRINNGVISSIAN